MTIEQLFFELIRIAIGTQDTLSRAPSAKEWNALYDMAKKQSLVGICFAGVQKLGEGRVETYETLETSWNLPKLLYLTWMGMAAKIQQRNEVMNASTKKALELFRKDGFECSVLKGQAIAKLYGNLAGLRQSGDIDLWVEGGRKKLYGYSHKTFGKLEGLTYHHIHFPVWDDVEIEAHTRPSFLSSPIRNKRLHKFCTANATKEDTPSLAFNRVFILLHCYQHFTRRGVGMRQLLDYYFVLLHSANEVSGGSEVSKVSCQDYKQESMHWITALGMKRFAEATMWVMKEVFGLDDNYLLCKPNEEYGRFLLDEVMQTGNMGHADERVDHRQLQSAVGRYLFNLKRDIRIIKICPHEALWEPLWGIYQFTWCKLTQLKYKR